jgi:hypothetical protein
MFCCTSTIAYAVVLTKRTFSKKTDGLASSSISVPKAHINGVKFDLRVRLLHAASAASPQEQPTYRRRPT